jgi:hypothetical protein
VLEGQSFENREAVIGKNSKEKLKRGGSEDS